MLSWETFAYLHEGPKLFKAIELTSLAVLEGLLLEISVEIRPELPFKAVTVEAEEALQSISEETQNQLQPKKQIFKPIRTNKTKGAYLIIVTDATDGVSVNFFWPV